MRSYFLLTLFALMGIVSCIKDQPVPAPPPVSEILLKDVIINKLPSPYYHFEYDASGHLNKAGWADNQLLYQVTYENSRLVKQQNTTTRKDRLEYVYNDHGQVELIKVINEGGTTYRLASLFYSEKGQLRELDWEVRIDGLGFAAEQNLTFTYFPDGNLKELRDQRLSIDGRQPAALYIDHFDQYDEQVNVDGFSLLHPYDQHLPLLPGVHLQYNNPGKNIRSGDGLNYEITYTYTYNANKAPVTRVGDMVETNGSNPGRHTSLQTSFTYY